MKTQSDNHSRRLSKKLIFSSLFSLTFKNPRKIINIKDTAKRLRIFHQLELNCYIYFVSKWIIKSFL